MVWSAGYNCCEVCKTTTIPHMAKGKCKTCYSREWYRAIAKEQPIKEARITEADLIELYLGQRMSCNEVATLKNCTGGLVKYYLKKYGIETRRPGISQVDFIRRCTERWGDRYDLSRTIYLAAKKPIIVVCPKEGHGEFKVNNAESFPRGTAQCPQCQPHQKLTISRFLALAKEAHGNKYIYNDLNTLTYSGKILITCKKHADFVQTIGSHLSGNGCPDCGNENAGLQQRKLLNVAIADFQKVHGNTYDYSKVEYVGNETPIIIICPSHGAFSQLPNNHMRGKGCPLCGREMAALNRAKDTATFVKEAQDEWGNIYDYSESIYQSAKDHVVIICREHGRFEKTPDKHIRGQGCPGCANYGFDQTKAATLYYLRVFRYNQQPLYKIGITNRSIEDRFSDKEDRRRISVIQVREFKIGRDAYLEEQKILSKYKLYKYHGPDVLWGHGNSELFISDVLELDTPSNNTYQL